MVPQTSTRLRRRPPHRESARLFHLPRRPAGEADLHGHDHEQERLQRDTDEERTDQIDRLAVLQRGGEGGDPRLALPPHSGYNAAAAAP